MATTKLSKSSTLALPNSSIKIPQLGFGIYLSPPNVCKKSCLAALRSGYRHIDSAQFYQNEAEMGEAVRESGIAREQVFLTTKILTAGGNPEKTYQKCVESVRKVNGGQDGGYVDLFLIHSPSGGENVVKEMWQALERLHKAGQAKAIGVSNCGVSVIENMKQYAQVWPPHVNQIELHPWCQQRSVVTYCMQHKIVVEAYCPLVRNQKAYDETLTKIATAHDKATTQILVRYSLQKGWVTLPKSDTPSRIEANGDVYGFELSGEEMKVLDGLDLAEEGAICQAAIEWN